ncbi:uncharacterized protein G2W53_010148 [Senna tora]|uniref:Uncharacterized protein n=1 Tax=Senna tora TaxID=362788 RepID=A0A835C9A4_9FABA|nr:uncharacterized protein G2W53_010148 [Senna tora]
MGCTPPSVHYSKLIEFLDSSPLSHRNKSFCFFWCIRHQNKRVSIDPNLTVIPKTRPLHGINFFGFESSYSLEETVSLESGSTVDFFRIVQNTSPLLTSSEENALEVQTRIDLTSYTSSYTQTSSKTSFSSTHSWEDSFDSSEEGDDNSQTTLSGNLSFKLPSHLFPNQYIVPLDAIER